MEKTASKKSLQSINPRKIILPIIIGLSVAAFLMIRNYNPDHLEYLKKVSLIAIVLSVLVLLIRDGAYVYRIRHLTNKELTWKGSIFVIILWEFASAVTPSVVGGTAVAIFILNREGISFGKAIAYVLLTAILDNLFFVLSAPFVVLLSQGTVFNIQYSKGIQIGFWVSYALIALYTFLMIYGLFFRPRAFKWILIKITSFRWLRKWRKAANENGNEMILASKEMRGKPGTYWLKAIVSTVVVWVARYAMLNCLIGAFVDVDFQEHLLIFSRQIIMWITMLISITPGSSGTAEIIFPAFFKQFLGSFSTTVAIIWRFFTYYPYLILGALFLPQWIRRAMINMKNKKPEKANPDS